MNRYTPAKFIFKFQLPLILCLGVMYAHVYCFIKLQSTEKNVDYLSWFSIKCDFKKWPFNIFTLQDSLRSK